jgi:autotransporter-associated beta strand protein
VSNNATLVFNNTAPIVINGTTNLATVVLQGTSTGDNTFTPQLVGTNVALTKDGAGRWVLGNTNNTYSGTTTITTGQLVAQDANSTATSATTLAPASSSTDLWVNNSSGLVIGQSVSGTGLTGSPTIAAILDPTHIRLSSTQSVATGTTLTFGSIASLSASSNLLFNQSAGGTEAVLESAGTFSRAVGTGAGQVQWAANASGGFAASSSPLNVTLGGSASFGTGGIGNGTGQLYLNSTTALSDVNVTGNLNLNGAVRTVNVFDNAATNTDFATISGVISGGTGSAFNKIGVGTLYLVGANTYSGNTTLTAGNTFVQTLGGGSTPASAFGDASGIISLSGGTLFYMGTGETSARRIQPTTNATIEQDGGGALVLTNLVNATTGAKTLTLRGTSQDANTISSALTDNNGAFSITKTDGGTWFLTGANTFSGGITMSSGWLGVSVADATPESGRRQGPGVLA